MNKIALLLPLFFLVVLGCKTEEKAEKSTFLNANNKVFHYEGRTEQLTDSSTVFISPASSVTFNTENDSITLYLKSQTNSHNYISVAINGEYLQRYKVEPDSINKIGIKLPEGSVNGIGIYKATEASNGGVIFLGAEGKKITEVTNIPDKTIEFIGDSITCGMGADIEEIPCGTTDVWYDQHNAYLAYGPISARALDAKYLLSSVSGMGMYRNWNDEDTAPVMPDVYETLNLDGNKDKLWDFDQYSPDLVSICLGTNDLSEGDGEKERLPFNKEKYTEAYIGFVKGVYERYPDTKVALLTSPMISGDKGEVLLECLNKVKDAFADDHTIAVFEFDTITPGGCGSHPDLDDHQKMADMLIPFYKDLLNQ